MKRRGMRTLGLGLIVLMVASTGCHDFLEVEERTADLTSTVRHPRSSVEPPAGKTRPHYGPVWFPDGKNLICTHGRKGLYMVDAQGTTLTKISTWKRDEKSSPFPPEDVDEWSHSDHSPDVSPDGSRIVYATSQYVSGGYDSFSFLVRYKWARQFELETADPDGSNPVRLTFNAASEGAPAWSPDGKEIAFVRYYSSDEDDSREGIYVMAADGSSRRLLLDFSPVEPVVARKHVGIGPVWSPDGERLAYVLGERYMSKYGYSDRDVLFVLGPDGYGPINLFSTIDQRESWIGSSPVWSPNGEKLAFFERDSRGSNRLYTIRPDGTDLRELGDGFSMHRLTGLQWSPDGTKLLYGFGAGPKNVLARNIYVLNSDGSDPFPVTKGGYASWSPDGSLIAITPHSDSIIPDDIDFYVATANADGGDRRILVVQDESGGLVAANPAPSP